MAFRQAQGHFDSSNAFRSETLREKKARTFIFAPFSSRNGSPGRTRTPLAAGFRLSAQPCRAPPTKGLIPPPAGLYRLDLPQITTNTSSLDPSLKDHRLASVPALLAPDKLPRPSSDLGSSAQHVLRIVVLSDTTLHVIRLPAIVSARTLTLDDVHQMPHRILKQQSPSPWRGSGFSWLPGTDSNRRQGG